MLAADFCLAADQRGQYFRLPILDVSCEGSRDSRSALRSLQHRYCDVGRAGADGRFSAVAARCRTEIFSPLFDRTTDLLGARGRVAHLCLSLLALAHALSSIQPVPGDGVVRA